MLLTTFFSNLFSASALSTLSRMDSSATINMTLDRLMSAFINQGFKIGLSNSPVYITSATPCKNASAFRILERVHFRSGSFKRREAFMY
jgi:hypothetical protein